MEDAKIKEIEKETARKMDQAIEVFKKDLASVRTGRAHPGILAHVMVDYYGTPTPLPNLANIAVLDSQMLTVSPYDGGILKDVEKAINNASLGMTASQDGRLVRVPVPTPTEERRKELVKQVKKMGEDAKIAIRNVRRDANDRLKKMEKEKAISQDAERTAQDHVQAATDNHVKNIDKLVVDKDKELMTV
ncbi:MAG: ribosome recycling factor [Deltaproteobacteria bacterium]|nr:ribosome recycling factor [Deltaproteobacteria bacterium]